MSAEIQLPTEPCTTEEPTITEEFVAAFRKAIGADHVTGVPASFATIYRDAEFQWLEKLGVDLHDLLHKDQEYLIHIPLKPGDTPVIHTRVMERKERRGMAFYRVDTEVRCDGELKITCKTGFVVRSRGKK